MVLAGLSATVLHAPQRRGDLRPGIRGRGAQRRGHLSQVGRHRAQVAHQLVDLEHRVAARGSSAQVVGQLVDRADVLVRGSSVMRRATSLAEVTDPAASRGVEVRRTRRITGWFSLGTGGISCLLPTRPSRSMYSRPVTPCSDSSATVSFETARSSRCRRSPARRRRAPGSMRMVFTRPTSTPR